MFAVSGSDCTPSSILKLGETNTDKELAPCQSSREVVLSIAVEDTSQLSWATTDPHVALDSQRCA